MKTAHDYISEGRFLVWEAHGGQELPWMQSANLVSGGSKGVQVYPPPGRILSFS